jgi:hypothetical protein
LDRHLEYRYQIQRVGDCQAFHVGEHEAVELFAASEDVEAEDVAENSGRGEDGHDDVVRDVQAAGVGRVVGQVVLGSIRGVFFKKNFTVLYCTQCQCILSYDNITAIHI